MQAFHWVPLQREIREHFKIVKKQTLPYALILIGNWQTPAKMVAPEQQINCLMTVKDIRAMENIDEQILCDWFI